MIMLEHLFLFPINHCFTMLRCLKQTIEIAEYFNSFKKTENFFVSGHPENRYVRKINVRKEINFAN